MKVKIRLPIKIYSLNQLNSMHWRNRHLIAQRQKSQLFWAFQEAKMDPTTILPCEVTITRYGPRKLDHDNFLGGAKAIRDFVACQLFPDTRSGTMDDSDEITWKYEQATSKEYGLQIEIVSLEKHRKEG